MARRLPARGENLFQRIKRIRTDYEERTGRPSINLSVGEPDGVPTQITRQAACRAAMSEDRAIHVYQDNGSPDGFDRSFVRHHVPAHIADDERFATLPIPGIKPMLGLLPLACGLHLDGAPPVVVAGTTKPGYPIIKTWCGYLDCAYHDWPLYAKHDFMPRLSDAPEGVNLVLFNYPNNPTGATMDAERWRAIIGWALENNVRLVNDAAYAGLVHREHATLSEVAAEYDDLEWMELFSASKSHNATGWRVGVAFGSADFIADLTMIKGNSDSGFAAPMAIGAMEAIEHDQAGLTGIRDLYAKRIDILVGILKDYLKPAVEPGAGFFTFWHAPDEVFGEPADSADAYNSTMVERCGLVGVPYTGSDGEYIRYAVCFPLEEPKYQDAVRAAMEKAQPKYRG